ncbi:hypothetical protein [Rhodohalobacter halophilus]|uniref:hypothetical protein n=1 Tax=Rhodohalobacter halophilus TaxID=1812810 RepID=UPI000A0725A3|nr:hypothetical protein [Rhodohalobacter halophilus]
MRRACTSADKSEHPDSFGMVSNPYSFDSSSDTLCKPLKRMANCKIADWNNREKKRNQVCRESPITICAVRWSLAILTVFLLNLEGLTAQNLYETGSTAQVQNSSSVTVKSPSGAFLRSMLVPGWGHFYAGEAHRNRGYIHTGSDLTLLGAIFGFNLKANRIENDFETYVSLNAGVDISSRSRSFRLAVADFNSLEEHNDYQLRSRNWNRLIDDIPENRWFWNSTEERGRYVDMRSEAESIRNQLPALAGLMVVNRIVSGISAYNRVRKDLESNRVNLSFQPVTVRGINSNSTAISGVTAQLNLYFN